MHGLNHLGDDLMVNQNVQQIGRTFDPNLYRRQEEDQPSTATAAAMALLMDRRRGGGGGGGGGGAGVFGQTYDPGFDHEVLYGPNVEGHEGHLHLAAPTGLKRLGNFLENKGFDVGEHAAFGGVDPVHTSGSHHYDNDALDINYNGGGRWENEADALTWLKRRLRRVYGDDAYYG